MGDRYIAFAMPPPETAHESRTLWGSVAATAGLGVLGVLWGIAAGSQMILLDGAYGLVGVVVSVLLIRASAVSAAPPTSRFNYGRGAATPLAIVVQGLVLLGTLGYAALEAVWVIRGGGSEVGAGSALTCGVVATAGAVGVWRWISVRAADSDLLVAEATAWRVAALRGLGMVAGFGMPLAIDGRYVRAEPYVDPAMVLVTCVVFLPEPLRMIRRALVELQEGAPEAHVQELIDAAVAEVQARFDLAAPVVRSTKVRRRLYVEVEGVVPSQVTVAQEHEVLTAVRQGLAPLPYDVWLNVELLPRLDESASS